MPKKLIIKPTCRGFGRANFTDSGGKSCSIQISSAIRDERLLWLGCNDIGLVSFTPNTNGWRDHTDDEIKKLIGPEVQDILANTRMHLTQSQVKALLPMLKKFVKTGELS